MSSQILDDGFIKPTVARREAEVNEILKVFISTISVKNNVVGLDAKWTVVADNNGEKRRAVAVLQLCWGSKCLIILQLLHMASIPKSLFDFLGMEQVTFVGFGIKRIMLELEKEYGLWCKNAVELKSLATEVLKNPYLNSCGISEWADYLTNDDDSSDDDDYNGFYYSEFCYSRGLRKNLITTQNNLLSSVFFSDWGAADLNNEQVTSAVISAYDFQMIGTKLHVIALKKTDIGNLPILV